MNFEFSLSEPLSPANILECARACGAVYDSPNVNGYGGENALVLDCRDCVLVAFPGTHDLADVLRDLDCGRRYREIGGQVCAVHRGFDRSHEAIRAHVHLAASRVSPGAPLFVTGHSKGAAVAKRFALEARIARGLPIAGVITFGEPRGGDARYAALYQAQLGPRSLRITNAADPMPWLPGWAAGNRHCGPEAWMPADGCQLISGPSLWLKLLRDAREIHRAWKDPLHFLRDHHMDSYSEKVAALLNQTTDKPAAGFRGQSPDPASQIPTIKC